jgi:hypothetical protein
LACSLFSQKVLPAPVAMLLSVTAKNQLPEIVQTVRRIFNQDAALEQWG